MFDFKRFFIYLILVLVSFLVGFFPIFLPVALADGMTGSIFITILFILLFAAALPIIEYYVIFIIKKSYTYIKTFIGNFNG